MNPKELENPEEWASKTFASAELGDVRRTDRLVQIAVALAEEPAAWSRWKQRNRKPDVSCIICESRQRVSLRKTNAYSICEPNTSVPPTMRSSR